MSVILLHLEGPMQSWGIGSRFTDRHTEAEPTKSGVIGLIANALGRSREDQIDDLVKLEMAVRVDREGEILYDYHTVMDVLKANAKQSFTASKLGTVVSRRFFIADACFLVGLQGDDSKLLKKIISSLKMPRRPFFLGRKSFPLSAPICINDNVETKPLKEIMSSFPWQGRNYDDPPANLRIIYECGLNEGESRMDVPLSFSTRRFLERNVSTEFIPFNQLTQEE